MGTKDIKIIKNNMLNEITSRTKQCSECGVIAHNSIIQNHTCETKEVKKEEKKEVKPKAKNK